MITPYSEKQVSEGVISCSVSSYGYDLRVADEFKIFTNVNRTIVDPNHFDERSFVTVNAGRDRPVEFVCAGAVGRILQDSARCADHLRGQVHLRALRDHRERHAIRAGVGRLRRARDLEHHAAAGEDLRQTNASAKFSSSSRTRFARPVTRIARESTRRRKGLCCRSCRAAFSTQPSALSFQFDCGARVGSAVDERPANHSKTLRSNSCGAALCAPV
jgi:hypothetical protein